jgi:hypothetical protein
MRLLFLTAAAIFSLGCGMCLAQIATVPSATTPPSSTQAPTFAGPANLLRPGGTPGTLGAIQFNLGSPIVGSGPGAIQICPATGTAAAIANFPVDATDVTTNAAPGFGTSEMSGNCGPGSPASSPEILSGSEFSGVLQGSQFSDGAVPLSATEAGGSGLSPLIAVPGPGSPSASCASNSGMSESSGLPAPYYSGDVAGTPPQPGC